MGCLSKNYQDLGGVQHQFAIFRSSQARTAIGWHCAPKPEPRAAQLGLLSSDETNEAPQNQEVCIG